MATMNNATIIFNESLELMKSGIIGTTGRTITVEVIENGQPVKKAFQEPEPIHTFQDWKNRGFYVKKGEKAIASFTIWNYHNNHKENDEQPEGLVKSGYYYMKKASFFKRSQVEKAGDPIPAAATPEPIQSEPVKAPEAVKKAAKTDIQKAYDYIVKNGAKNKSQMKCGSLDGLVYATEGHQLMRTSAPVECEPLEKYDAICYTNLLKNGIKTEKTSAFDLDAKAIRAGIKAAKNGKRGAKVVYSNGEGLVLNANYLLNAITATGATEYKWTDHKLPVVFENDSTFYMVLPINWKNNGGNASMLPEGFHTI